MTSLLTFGQPLVLVATRPAYSACWVARTLGIDLQDGVRLFGTGGDDAAWARVLEATADNVDAVGQQRGGQAVTGITLVGLAVEGEVQDLAAVDTAAAGEAIGLAHTFSPWPLTVDAALVALPLAVTCGFSPIL